MLPKKGRNGTWKLVEDQDHRASIFTTRDKEGAEAMRPKRNRQEIEEDNRRQGGTWKEHLWCGTPFPSSPPEIKTKN
jgi:hypothetical protein